MDCLFCKIAKREIPTSTIYEDDLVKVFLDIHPQSDGHMLIITKEHCVDIKDVPTDTLNYIYKNIAPQMYALVTDRLGATGCSLTQNNGSAEDIKHYHVHLIPRFTKRGISEVSDIFKLLQ